MNFKGIHALIERNVLSKLIAHYSFDHWDFDESVAIFFLQYLAMIGLFTGLAYYAMRFFLNRNRLPKKSVQQNEHRVLESQSRKMKVQG